MDTILSQSQGLGQVVLCQHCEDVHLMIGAISLRLSKETFVQLSKMIGLATSHLTLSGKKEPNYLLSFREGRPHFEQHDR